MKKILALALAMLMLAAGAAWAAAPKTVLRMSIGDPDNSDMGIVANAFKKYVEEKSNGTVEVDIFYAGGLGEDEGVQFRNTQTGKLASWTWRSAASPTSNPWSSAWVC